jgi:hypothetical protein
MRAAMTEILKTNTMVKERWILGLWQSDVDVQRDDSKKKKVKQKRRLLFQMLPFHLDRNDRPIDMVV